MLVRAYTGGRASALQPRPLLGSDETSLAMVLPSCSSAQSCEVCPNAAQHHALRPRRYWHSSQWSGDLPDSLQQQADAELQSPGDGSRAEITFGRSKSESHVQLRIVWCIHTWRRPSLGIVAKVQHGEMVSASVLHAHDFQNCGVVLKSVQLLQRQIALGQ